jgi:hypothetical protein
MVNVLKVSITLSGVAIGAEVVRGGRPTVSSKASRTKLTRGLLEHPPRWPRLVVIRGNLYKHMVPKRSAGAGVDAWSHRQDKLVFRCLDDAE